MEKTKTVIPTSNFVKGNLRTIQDEIDQNKYTYNRKNSKPGIISYNFNEYLGTIYNLGSPLDLEDRANGSFKVDFNKEELILRSLPKKIKALASIVLKETVNTFNNKEKLKEILNE